MRKILLSIVFICLPVLGFAYDDGDWQYWNQEGIEVGLTDRLGASLETNFRWGDNVSEFYYQATYLELAYEVTSWFELAPAYRHLYQLDTKTKTEDDWFAEYRPTLNGTVKWKWADWRLSNKTMVEYRMFSIDKEDVWRFRDKITIRSPWKWTGLEINPYVAEEIFVEEHKDGIYRNRVYAGIGLKLFSNVKGEIYYLWQTEDTGDSWNDTNVLGTSLKLVF